MSRPSRTLRQRLREAPAGFFNSDGPIEGVGTIATLAAGRLGRGEETALAPPRVGERDRVLARTPGFVEREPLAVSAEVERQDAQPELGRLEVPFVPLAAEQLLWRKHEPVGCAERVGCTNTIWLQIGKNAEADRVCALHGPSDPCAPGLDNRTGTGLVSPGFESAWSGV
jgi:hypothetical protein